MAELQSAVLSPHFDDAAYSCWHALQESTSVITIFGGIPENEDAGPWDHSTGFINARNAIDVRTAENNAAFNTLDIETVSFGYIDTEYRFRDQLQEPTPANIATSIRKVLAPDAHILAPLGFGYKFRHRDHELVREAAKLLLTDGHTTRFYVDIPYAMEKGSYRHPRVGVSPFLPLLLTHK